MKKTNFIVFDRKNIEEFLDIVDAHIESKLNADESVTVFVANEDGEPFFCHNCDRLITPQDIGNVAPGSRHFFCKRSTCFSRHIIEQKV